MTRILKNRPMFFALLLASMSQFFAIVGDQYVLNLDFRVERLENRIEFNKSLQSDLQNTVKVLRRAARYRDHSWLDGYFNNGRGLQAISDNATVEIEKNLRFMTEEVEKLYRIYSISVVNRSSDETEKQKDVADIYSFAKPLYNQIYQTEALQNIQKQELEIIENRRHLVIILAVIAQMLSLLSLLWFFLIELRRPPSEI